MIVSPPIGKKLPLDELAFTKKGEVCYFIDPSVIKPTDDEAGQVALSKSGEEWYPKITDKHRLTIFIAGNPGAGKSYLATELINLIPRGSEGIDVLLFTALEEPDGNFEKLSKDTRLWKIKLDAENLSRITLSVIRERCKHPVLLFDDIDKIRDSKISNAVYKLLEDALANGRGHKKHDGTDDVHVVTTSHAINDYRKTKYMFENSDYVALFPQSTTATQLTRIFDKMGFPRELCESVKKLGRFDGVRRIIIRKIAPMYLIAGPNITLV